MISNSHGNNIQMFPSQDNCFEGISDACLIKDFFFFVCASSLVDFKITHRAIFVVCNSNNLCARVRNTTQHIV